MWTEQITRRLMVLARTETYQDIADTLNREFGTSMRRNAVAGKLRRLRMDADSKPKEEKPEPEHTPTGSHSARITFAGEFSQCQWIDDEMCLEKIVGPRLVGAHNYCQEHQLMAIQHNARPGARKLLQRHGWVEKS